MGFGQTERSNFDAVPTSLYEFTLGNKTWRYAAGRKDISYGGKTFEGIPIDDDGISQSGDTSADDFVVTLPASADINTIFLGTPPSEEVTLIVRDKLRGEKVAPIVYTGLVRHTKRVSQVEMNITCGTLIGTLKRNGLRLTWSRGCPHALYDRSCGVDPADHAVNIEVDELSGTRIISRDMNTQKNGLFDGGYVEWTSTGGVKERRGIEVHRNRIVHILGLTDGLSPGDVIKAYPGCNRTTSACENKFNNLGNFGGFPHLPGKSPFDGRQVY